MRGYEVVALTLGLVAAACANAMPPSKGTPPPAVAAAPVRLQSIGAIRASALGTRATLEGTVSTPSGAFNSSYYDLGFAVQDRTGGIFVSLPFDLGRVVGQRVRVTGTRADSSGLAIFVPDHPNDVTLLPGRGEIRPRSQTTGSIGEATEGFIVELHARAMGPVAADLPYGYKLTVDDGSGPVLVFINLETGIDPTHYHAGDRLRVIGFSSQYADHYEVDPRSTADLRVED